MVTQEEIDRHNDVTRLVITGTLAEVGGLGSSAAVRTAHEIMDVLKRRGYTPQILSLNQLADGTRI
jgi:hypothetical protein